MRADELEQLLRLGGALDAGMDADAFERTLIEHLRPLIGRRGVRLLLEAGQPRLAAGASDRSANAAGASATHGAWCAFPLVAGDTRVGTLEVEHAAAGGTPSLSARQRRLLQLASPLVARAVSNAQRCRDAERRAAVDALTGCVAACHGMELVGVELRRARRYGRPAALLFIDLDRFKQVNDRYGHVLGDAVLSAVGATLRNALRGSDLCCRYGGDEFLVLLPETPLDGALHVAEKLRRRVAATTVEQPVLTAAVTASIGVAAARPDELDAGRLLARADSAMYRAKRAGRNAVRVSPDEPVEFTPGCAAP